MNSKFKLYGSQTSPFVRRLRLLLEPTLYDFVTLDIFSAAGRETLRRLSPVMKIPVLQDGDRLIYDSRVIQRYLADKGFVPRLNWQEENTLSVIDGVSDSLVNTLLLKRSGIVLDVETILGRSHSERMTESFLLLEASMQDASFKEWGFLSMCLYSLLDWARFRDLVSLEPYPALEAFLASRADAPRVSLTDPRRG